jgi:hypothetical protein
MTRQILTSRSALTAALLVIAVLLMAACGTKLTGKYSSSIAGPGSSQVQVEFKSGNKANFSAGGTPAMEMDYEVSGKEVKLKTGPATMVATLTDDGCLDFGGDLGKLCKQTKQ